MNSMRYRLFFCFSLVLSCIPVRAQETAAAQANPVQDTSATTTDSSVLKYLDQITEQEKLHGAYDPQLSEQLLGLGLLYQNLEQYAEAGKVLNRALHIRKVNDGLESMTQAPILKALIGVNTAARNWEELDQNYHGLLWLYQRNLKSDDPAFLPVILAVGRWKLEAYTNGLVSDNRAFILNDLVEMFRTTVEIMEDQYGVNDPRLIVPLRILSLAYYQQVNEVFNSSIEDFQGDGNRYTYRQRCILDPRTNQVVCGMEEVPNTNYYTSKQQNKDRRVAEQMHKVRSMLDRIATVSAANSTNHPAEYAMALVNLGDWYFINNQRTTAVEKYKQAYQILTDSGPDQTLINNIFGKPVRIPVMSTALSTTDTE
ncbi:MAG: hypothetical protein HW386_1364, partial [Gammaproteobacteria bacterium]|nr:hypothetical protein [Gammaproteobacteria bacterium]